MAGATGNEKIILKDASAEMFTLVNSFNEMVDELEESAVKLAKGEREQAWREMAKQVAHEIKNPLTPMRLTVQSFQRKFDPTDPNIDGKINEFSKTLIQQIDTMSSIASAFSNFAKMPTQNREELNVVKVVKYALDIFTEDYIASNRIHDNTKTNNQRFINYIEYNKILQEYYGRIPIQRRLAFPYTVWIKNICTWFIAKRRNK